MRLLLDVDGVVADLMDGFERFFLNRTGELLRPNLSVTHRISHSPAHAELHARYDLDQQLTDFLALPNVYHDYVELVPGAKESIDSLYRAGHEIGFVTATLWTAPESYGSKMRWLDELFPEIPMLSVGSGEKHWVTGDYAVDDRYDTCLRWSQAGVTPLLFRRPWNEAPPGTRSYDWKEIMDEFTFPR